MTWRDRQERGSYRGVSFLIRDNSLETGRRTAIYEIPGSELGAGHVDNGRRAWRQSMTVMTLGLDYDLDRDALIEAFNEPGPGELIHPYYGRRNVVIDGPVSVVESTTTGGQAVFTFTAVEVAQRTPGISRDTAGALRSAAGRATDAIGAAYVAAHSVQGENFLQLDAIEKMNTALGDLREITGKIDTVLAAPSKVSSLIDAMTAEIVDIIKAPQRFVDRILGVMVSLKDAMRQIKGAIGGYANSSRQSGEIGSTILPLDASDTPSRRQQAANSRATREAVRGLTLVALADVAADFEFETADDVRTVRDTLTTQIDTLIEEQEAGGTTLEDAILSPDPEVYQALRDVQAALHRHLVAVEGTAVELSQYTPGEPIPSVVAAQVLYGDATRFEGIERRNTLTIRHPGFLPAHETYSVEAE